MAKIQEEINIGKKYVFPDDITFDNAWKIFKEHNHSTVDSLFSGMTRSAVICLKCQYQSSN